MNSSHSSKITNINMFYLLCRVNIPAQQRTYKLLQSSGTQTYPLHTSPQMQKLNQAGNLSLVLSFRILKSMMTTCKQQLHKLKVWISSKEMPVVSSGIYLTCVAMLEMVIVDQNEAKLGLKVEWIAHTHLGQFKLFQVVDIWVGKHYWDQKHEFLC